MQNRYVGDIGDFGKYGLLRALSGEFPVSSRKLRLGIVWYLHPDEPNSDGNFTRYLDDHRNHDFKVCDPPLYETLGQLVLKGNRHIACVRQSGILPGETSYYEEVLPYLQNPQRKQEPRENWLRGALQTTVEADVVFLDPDNGVCISGDVKPWHKKGRKYVFTEEIRPFVNRKQSIVIYHHLNRQKKATAQIRHLSQHLQSSLDLPRPPLSLWYHRGTARVFFIFSHERHQPFIEKRLRQFLKSHWGDQAHFERVCSSSTTL